jgi:hypothetical protein
LLCAIYSSMDTVEGLTLTYGLQSAGASSEDNIGQNKNKRTET